MAEPVRPGTGRPRIVELDARQGVALCGIVAYHVAWDFHALGWPAPDPSRSPGWIAFGDLVAGTFLAPSLRGIALARPKGLDFVLRRLRRRCGPPASTAHSAPCSASPPPRPRPWTTAPCSPGSPRRCWARSWGMCSGAGL